MWTILHPNGEVVTTQSFEKAQKILDEYKAAGHRVALHGNRYTVYREAPKRTCFNCDAEISLHGDSTGTCPHCGHLLPIAEFEAMPEDFLAAYRRLEYDVPASSNSASELERLFSGAL
jgi:DNA-directed RNA polymerase subunit RPC12/RpoP